MGKVGSTAVKAALVKAGNSVLHTHLSSEAGDFYRNQANPVVITAVRDLLTRTISAFFQNLRNKENPYWYLGDMPDRQDVSTEELIRQFKLRAPRHMEEIIFPWFARFEKSFGLDVFQTSFDRQTGYQYYKLPTGSDLLLYRYENLDNLSGILSNYGDQPIQFERANCSNKKWYAECHSAFKNKISFTPEELDFYYDNPLTKHFYDVREIENMRAAWVR